jgi:hypothetical protein
MNRILLLLVPALSGLILAGCGKSSNSAATDETVLLGPQYSSKNGLLLPDETKRSLGVKIDDVTERKVPMDVDFQLRVYKMGNQQSLATGDLCPEQAKQLSVGQSVELRTSTGGKRSGKIAAVQADLPKSADLAEVLVEIPGAPELGMGEFLQATAALSRDQTTVAIPRSALLHLVNGYSVYTVNGEHFLRTRVEIGAANDEWVEIKDGLYTGDKVVVDPVMPLWLTELAAVNGGQACCVVPAKGK